MFFAKVCAVFTFALSAAAISTPHMARNMAVHHAMAARAPVAEPEPVVARVLPKRANVRRCKPHNGTQPSVSPSSSSVVLPTPAKTPQPVVNPEPAPPVFSSSSVAPAPSHSSSHSVSEKPATTSTPPPPPKSTPAKPTTHAPPPAEPTPEKGSGSGSASGSSDPLFTDTHSGDATFYATGLGACGITNHDTDLIAAVSHLLFDTFPGYNGGNPNNNPICGRKAKANYNGNTVTVTLTDRCVGCDKFDLDFSPAAFDRLGDEAIGRLHGMTWTFV